MKWSRGCHTASLCLGGGYAFEFSPGHPQWRALNHHSGRTKRLQSRGCGGLVWDKLPCECPPPPARASRGPQGGIVTATGSGTVQACTPTFAGLLPHARLLRGGEKERERGSGRETRRVVTRSLTEEGERMTGVGKEQMEWEAWIRRRGAGGSKMAGEESAERGNGRLSAIPSGAGIWPRQRGAECPS